MEVNKTAKFVVLRHLTMPHKGMCFFTANTATGRDCYSIGGDLWYEIVDFADTVEEAQRSTAKHYGGCPSQKEFIEYTKQKQLS